MDLIIFCIVILIVVGIIVAIMRYIPFPPPLSWLRWAIPAVALLIALVVILQKLGVV